MDSMRKAGLALVLVLVPACRSVPKPWGEGVELGTELLGGGRALVDHEHLDGHWVAGLELTTRDRELGWGYELGGSYGSEEEDTATRKHEAELTELYVGLRRGWEQGATRPYVGFGASLIAVENTLRSAGPTVEFDDNSGGAYLHGGVLWSLGRYDFDRGTEILAGFDLRGVLGQEVDYGQLALVLAFGR
jgi:hypothetical protein